MNRSNTNFTSIGKKVFEGVIDKKYCQKVLEVLYFSILMTLIKKKYWQVLDPILFFQIKYGFRAKMIGDNTFFL